VTPERWRRAVELFGEAVELPAGEREAFLAAECGDDAALAADVRRMVEADARPNPLVDAPLVEGLLTTPTEPFEPSLVGRRVAGYELTEKLGAGGMGEVYLARDAKLRRRVAVKLLRDRFTRDPGRMARFEREAYAASALSHPCVLHVYEFGEHEGRHYIVTEYVEGPTLRQRIAEGVKPSEALRIAMQVAEAVAAAHGAGVIHRDIKPENIVVRPDGYVKVLDFGIAKLTESEKQAGADAARTETGLVIGTARYMSPEQARGLEVDARTDVWSIGVVLYEMLTGRPPFDGPSNTDVLVSVLEREPEPLTRYLPAPAELQRIVGKALQKQREQRYAAAADLALDLESLRHELIRDGDTAPRTEGAATDGGDGAHGRQTRTLSSAEYVVEGVKRHKTKAVVAACLALLAAAGIFVGARLFGRPARPTATFREGGKEKLTTSGKAYLAAVSPDGKYVAYVSDEAGKSSIRLRQTATKTDVLRATSDDGFFWRLSFSPDGNYIYYVHHLNEITPTSLFRMPVLGGEPRKVSERAYSAATFSPDGRRIAFIRENHPTVDECALVVANADGSDERVVAARRRPDWLAEPAWSPDGETIACILRNSALPALSFGSAMRIVTVPASGGEPAQLGSQPWGAVLMLAWLPRGEGLVANAVDTESGKPQLWHVAYPGGEARRVTSDLSGFNGVGMTADGQTLVTVQETTISNIWVSPDASPAHARPVTTGTGVLAGAYGLDWTPAGRLLYSSTESGSWDVWELDSSTGGRRRLTDDPRQEWGAQATPDGRSVVFRSNREGRWNLYVMDAAGGNVRRLTSGEFDDFASVSPDGAWVFYMSSVGGKFSLWKVPLAGGEAALVTDREVMGPSLSPDGKLVVCFLRGGGADGHMTFGIFSAEDGSLVKTLEPPKFFNFGLGWTRDGRALTYLASQDGPSNIWRRPLNGGPAQPLTDVKTEEVLSYAWSRDGSRFACARGTVASDVLSITNAPN
jgi:Tol biopolymer transport system component/tRNA A-37 threonylcarbamoyl transferase component Bud32